MRITTDDASNRRKVRLAFCALIVLLAGCGSSSGAATNDATGVAATRQVQTDSPREPQMNAKSNCGSDNFSRSQCMIRLILDDLQHNFKGNAGGGITEIRAESSTSFTASWSKEERVEKYTYQFEVGKDGSVSIKSKTESQESFGH